MSNIWNKRYLDMSANELCAYALPAFSACDISPGLAPFLALGMFPCLSLNIKCKSIGARKQIFKKLFIYSHVHTLFGSFLPPASLSYPLPRFPHQFQAGPVLPLSLILLKKRHKHNKEDRAFLLVELRIAYRKIPSIAFMFTCVTTHADSTLTDLYSGY
jgi:hypothetical protein